VINKLVKNLFRKFGFEIFRLPSRNQRNYFKLLKNHNINLIFDVGANTGQFASNVFKMGFKGKIVSFEPIKNVFKVLENNKKGNHNWLVENFAIGDKNATTNINVSKNNESSSILHVKKLHVLNAPDSEVLSTEKIEIYKLDSIYNKYVSDNSNILLKIDSQGYEDLILDGAKEFLNNVVGIQIEMSLVELYYGQMLFDKLYSKMSDLGYVLMHISPSFVSPKSGQLLQFDGLFFKSKLL
jgi:FkbM family methyltransferase